MGETSHHFSFVAHFALVLVHCTNQVVFLQYRFVHTLHILVLIFLHTSHHSYKKIDRKEHTSELQSRGHLVCRLLLEKKNRVSDGKDSCYHTRLCSFVWYLTS